MDELTAARKEIERLQKRVECFMAIINQDEKSLKHFLAGYLNYRKRGATADDLFDEFHRRIKGKSNG